LAIVARERQENKEEVLPPNKLLLNAGAACDLSVRMARKTCQAQTKSGKPIMVRAFIAPVVVDEIENQIEEA